MRNTRFVILLEGPDGGGKSRLAEVLSSKLDARVVHCGTFPRVTHALPRLYLEAMLPALQGYQDVILDRAWPSEAIYGAVMRGGKDRVGDEFACMLERVAMRCALLEVVCLPPIEVCLNAYRSRRGAEYLTDEERLRTVHARYHARRPHRHRIIYDRTKHSTDRVMDALYVLSPLRHHLEWRTVGSRAAKTLLVGEAFAHHTNADTLQQHPFVSFNRAGCSWWLTSRLIGAHIEERGLMWANVNDPSLPQIMDDDDREVFALGDKAAAGLRKLGVSHTQVTHPQRAKRFSFTQRYPLLDLLTHKTEVSDVRNADL